jgi:CubicO group peptidase (beta-lactamase class C family)
MPRTDSAKRPDVEVVTAAVVDGTVAVGDVADTPVPWWSFTKTVLAAAALVLVDGGRLTLDTPLAGRRYTLRQLLQHRAGVPDYGALANYHDAVRRIEPPWPVADLLTRVHAHAREAEPGTSWTYSNVGYLFVRQLIEDAEGKEIGEAIMRLVLMPLGIANAGLARTPDDLIGTRWGNAGRYHPGWVYHGLMIGSPAAAALLLDRLLRGDLLSPASLHAMRESFRLGEPIPGRPWQAPGYGLGLMIETTTPPRFMGHTGGGPSSTAAVYHFPAPGAVVTASAFSPCEDPGPVEQRVVDIARAIAAGEDACAVSGARD